ncbi:mechanosensitive ion channel family protein [Alcanivorax sp. 1008]|uniref:mechanosensitive ion channel family protein n=1 Tax=Alcanivorax sp. 1008 TaxID=2816853 RepID=UPI001D9329E3|nr:mechanosensitive ion channel domain-containing protein [Alcanivorax sp. 1008]MCC1497735.1 mechanosensitive ion channel [Alcanivorax sp. 1008]
MNAMFDQFQQFALENVFPFGTNLIAALAIFIVGKWLAKRISSAVDSLLSKKIDSTVSKFIGNLTQIALLAVVAIATLDRLGVETTSLIAIVGAAGLAVGLALKDSLGNFASGVMLILFRPFRVGDYVEAGGAAGTIKEIRIFATIMTTPDNKVITVPNGAIMGGNIVNFSEMPTRRVDMVVGVGYGSDLAKVKQVISAILEQDKRVLADPAPVIAVSELADSSVNLIVRPWVNAADYWAVLWDTTESVKRRFDEEGIEIPFPQMDLHLSNPGKGDNQ